MSKKKAAKKANGEDTAPARKQKKVLAKPSVILVSFSASATIPTQQYGNIQPRIEVTADTIEEARATVMEAIESLYKQYAEKPLSGKDPHFYGRIVETDKNVVTKEQETSVLSPTAPAPKAPEPVAPASTTSVPATTTETPAPVQKPEPVLKAEKAISLAMTEDAAMVIQDQIEKSVKIPAEFKKDLLMQVLKKRGDLSKEGL